MNERRRRDMVIPSANLSLFTGGGGLDLALKRAVPSLRTVCYVEREAFAAAVIVARMESADLDQAPIWDDIATFDGRPWRGKVDLVSGGFPCQDISVAGKGAGLAGHRSGLWREYARIIDEIRPRFVFVENVAALVTRGLDRVLGDLAALGFDAEWCCVRASDAGAPHERKRIFILAYSQRDLLRDESGRRGGQDGTGSSVATDNGGEGSMAYPPILPKRESAIPSNTVTGERLARAFAVRGSWWASEPSVGRVAHGVADWVDRLRVLGNGVVPAQGALAWEILWKRMHEGERNA